MQSKPQSARMELMPRQSAILTGIMLEGPPIKSANREENHKRVMQENMRSHHADYRMLDNAMQALKASKTGY